MRYAMTGATGFLGTELARQLHEAGHHVVALVRKPSAAGELDRLGVEMVQGDLDDLAALDRILAGANGLFHVAGWYKHGRRQRRQLRHVNIDGTRNVLEAAARSGVSRVVYTSTLAVNSDTGGRVVSESHRFDGRHLSEYDRTKAVAHRIALDHTARGLPLVIMQPGVIYGPDDVGSALGQLTRRIVRGKRVLVPSGGGGATFAHVADVARGHVLAMERGRVGESYFLAGPTQTYADVLALVARLSGGRPPTLVAPGLVRLAARLTAPVEWVLPIPQFMTSEAARSGTGTYYGDSSKAQRQLGWKARPLEEGMAETVASIPRA